MTALQELLCDLRRRGVQLEAIGNGRLRINPVEKLSRDEFELVREYKVSILRLLAPDRQQRVVCPGDECDEVLTVVDGAAYCRNHGKHGMAVIFTEGVQ